MSKHFNNRPIVAMVISILTVIVGAVTITALPAAQFPNIVPPEVQALATYVGADAKTIDDWMVCAFLSTGFCNSTAMQFIAVKTTNICAKRGNIRSQCVTIREQCHDPDI